MSSISNFSNLEGTNFKISLFWYPLQTPLSPQALVKSWNLLFWMFLGKHNSSIFWGWICEKLSLRFKNTMLTKDTCIGMFWWVWKSIKWCLDFGKIRAYWTKRFRWQQIVSTFERASQGKWDIHIRDTLCSLTF